MSQVKPEMKTTAKADPAPSRWSYRYQRLMLTPIFRKALKVAVPFTLSLCAGLIYFADDTRRDNFNMALVDLRTEFENRPEFTVRLMAVDGAGSDLAENIRAVVPLDFPLSSFDLDLETIRAQVAELAPVKSAQVSIKSGGVLQIKVTERQPVAVWRHYDGLELIDATGVPFKQLGTRAQRPDLPLIAGEGAAERLSEAMRLLAAAAPLQDRLRGVARIGERRWDVVLDRGQRIMLPERGAEQALQRVLALNAARDLLSRDIAVVDMRLSQRPTVRMTADASEARREARKHNVGIKQE